MATISKNEYAQQCLALIEPTQHSDGTLLFLPLQWSDDDWTLRIKELEEELKGSTYKDWRLLITKLEAKLMKGRENDKKEEWYVEFTMRNFRPKDIFEAVDEGILDVFKRMMIEIGILHWTCTSREYRGATFLHWDVLYGQLDMVKFMLRNMAVLRRDFLEEK